MNRIYSLVFNHALRQVQVVSEHVRRRCGAAGKRKPPRQAMPAVRGLCLALALAAAPATAQVARTQLPIGVDIVDGIDEIHVGGGVMTVTQSDPRGVIRFNSFDIGEDARVVFDQPTGGIALNRILSPDASQILGRLDASGTVFLVNPNGIVFGESARLDVNGLIASTLEIDTGDFLDGADLLPMAGPGNTAAILNQGEIVAGSGGVTMVAGHVGNSGLVQAQLGSINLHGTHTATLSLDPAGRVAISLGTPVSDLLAGTSAAVENMGTLEAGATILMHGNTASDFAGMAVNTSGVVRATTIDGLAGRVELRGGAGALALGSVEASSLVADATTIHMTQDVHTGGDQTYQGAVQLTDDLDLTSASGDITFAGPVDGAHGLDVRALAGGVEFLGAVGATAGLAGLSVDASYFFALSTLDVAGGLSVTTEHGGITQQGAWRTGLGAELAAGPGSIMLTHAGNDFRGEVSLSGGSVILLTGNSLALGELEVASLRVISTGELSLGHGTIRGGLNALSNGGNIVQSTTHGLTVGGPSYLDAGSGAISLFQANNDLHGPVTAAGNGIQLVDSGDLTIAAVTLRGANSRLSLNAGGTLSLPAQAIDTGLANLVLASHGGPLVTRGALSGGSMILQGSGGMQLGHTISATTLSLHGGTGISQTGGALDVGTLHLATAGAATLDGENHIGALGNVHVDRNFRLRNVTGIQQAPGDWIGVFISGNASFDSDGDIILASQLNEFGGTVDLTGDTVRIQSSGALQLGALDVTSLFAQSHGALDLGYGHVAGNLVAGSSGVGIRQSGALAVGGTALMDAGSGSITLSDTDNDFGGPVRAVGSGIVLVDRNDLSISLLTVPGSPGGPVRLEAGGTLTLPAMAIDTGGHDLELLSRGGPLVTGGALAGENVTLVGRDGINLGHDVTAAARLQLDSGADIVQTGGTLAARLFLMEAEGHATLGSWNALSTVHEIHVGGDFLLRNTPAISQTAFGSIVVGGEALLESGGSINVASANNDFGGAVSATGNRITIVDRDLIAGTITGTDDVRLRSYGDITLEESVRGRNIDIAADGLFINDAGAGALDATESWRVHLATPHAGHQFGDLDSGNSAVWNTALFGPVAAPGNRYAFAYQPTLTFRSLDAGKIYGQAADLSGAYAVSGLMEGVSGAYLADTLGAVVTGTPALHSAGVGATATVAGGPYAIGIDQGDLADSGSGYALAFESQGSLTVNPATLTVTADSVARTYGQAAGLGGYTVEGLLNDDAVTGVDLASDGSAATATVGDYVITIEGASGTGLDNYNITYVDGVLSVGRAGLTITANDAAKTYGQTASLAGYTVEGLLNDDAVTGTSLASSGTAATATVGDYVITVDGATGEGLANYDISYVGGVLTVGKAGLVIQASDALKRMGEEIELEDYSVSGLVNDDRVTAVDLSSPGSAATALPGGYAIVAGNAAGTGLDNYAIEYLEGTLQVGVDPLPVTKAVNASIAPAQRVDPPAPGHAPGFHIEGEGLLMPPEAACGSLMPGSADCPPHSPR